MSENNNTINRDNNSQDTEFQDMLKEVFLKKDEIIHDRFKDDKKVADISFKKPEAKNDNPPAKKPSERPVEHSQSRPKQPAPKRLQGNENAKKRPESNDISFKKPASNPKAENAEHSEKKPVPHGSKRPVQNGAKRPVQNGAKRPVPNGAKRPVQNGSNNVSKPGNPQVNKVRQSPAPTARKNSSQSANGNPKQHNHNVKKSTQNSKLDKVINGKKGKTLTKKQKTLRIIGLILAALLVLALVGWCIFHFYFSLFGRYQGTRNNGEYYYNDSDYTDESNTLTAEEAEAALRKQLKGKATDLMKDKDVMNILLIGEDLRDTEESERGNTDVMMMISLNKKQKTITMTSFMRDAWVEIDDYGMAKLNAAYWIDGPELLKDTIQKHYGVSIDRYVIVNFESFIKIVDTLGGITLNVTDEEAEGMKAPMAEQNNILGNKRGTDYLKKGGKLKLNGNQALAFARLRYVGNADYERTQRQRRVINEIIKESKHLSLMKINGLLKEILPKVKIDLTEGEVASLLLGCFDYMDYEVQEIRIPADEMFSEEIIDGLSVLCPDFQANTREIIKTIYGKEALDKYDKENGIVTDENNYDENANYDNNATYDQNATYDNNTVDNNYGYDNNYNNDYGYDNNNYGYDNGYYGY